MAGFVVVASETASAAVPIDSCTTIDQGGRDYVLTRDLASTGTCIIITKSGVNFDGQGHTIENIGNEKSGYGIYVRESPGNHLRDVSVQNVQITGFTFGILVQTTDRMRIINVAARNNDFGMRTDSDQAVLLGNIATNNADTGIVTRNADEVSENIVRNNGVRGIYVQSLSDHTEVRSNTVTGHRGTYAGGPSPGIVIRSSRAVQVEGNTLDDNGIGVLLIRGANALIRGNEESGEATGNAIAIRLVDSSGNTVDRNSMRAPIQIRRSHRNDIRRNEVTTITVGRSEQNLVFDNGVSTIDISISPQTSVLGNTITGRSSTDGIRVIQSSSTQIRGNEITGAKSGVLISGSWGTKIQFNDIRENTNGVRIFGEFGRGLTIRGNNFVRNSQYGIQNEVPEYVSARNNYWGAANGPSSPSPDAPLSDALTGELADGDGDAVYEWPERPGISNVGFDGWSESPNPIITREPPEIGPGNPPIPPIDR